MGYTHYYYVSSYYKQEAWDALLSDIKKLLELPIPLTALESSAFFGKNLGDLINSEEAGLNQGYYKINKTEISFNGIGELAHE
tara:strand:+ start:867 stop:1115 length:249 start_codon:yes stop_codon:yes gene_type:complete